MTQVSLVLTAMTSARPSRLTSWLNVALLPASEVGTGLNVAVYIVDVVGAVRMCARAPPSDHEPNTYPVPPRVCGVGAMSEFVDRWITVVVNGVVWLVEPRVTWSPG